MRDGSILKSGEIFNQKNPFSIIANTSNEKLNKILLELIKMHVKYPNETK